MEKEEIELLKSENENFKSEMTKMKEELETLRKPREETSKEEKPKDDDLLNKAKKEREEKEKNSSDSKNIESAIKFNLSVNDFIKNNEDILPGEVQDIIRVAEKENYDSAKDKANAVKVGIIGSFFSIQSNLDLLTQAQKNQLEDFQKLTKNGKEGLSSHVYDNIFEPAIEMLKKLKKADELGKARNGFTTASSVEKDYTQRLIDQARKGHLKETNK